MEKNETVENVETIKAEEQTIDNEEVANSLFSKMKDFFTVKEDTVNNDEQIKSLLETEEAKKLIEEEASKKANAKVTEILPKAKKEKEQELNERLTKLEEQKQELELNKSLEVVDDNFKDFVKHQAKQLNTSVEEFLNNNKQYLKNQNATQTKLETSSASGVELNETDRRIMESFTKITK